MMPSVGFGTAGLGEHTGQAVKEALLAGYALFDTAQVSILVAINL
jgi:diketogulonate reductase-like aldo/keto reductase